MPNSSGMPRVMVILQSVWPTMEVRTPEGSSPGPSFRGFYLENDEAVQVWMERMSFRLVVAKPDQVNLSWIQRPTNAPNWPNRIDLDALGRLLEDMRSQTDRSVVPKPLDPARATVTTP